MDELHRNLTVSKDETVPRLPAPRPKYPGYPDPSAEPASLTVRPKVPPLAKPLLAQKIGRVDLTRMIREDTDWDQTRADEAVDAVLGIIADWILGACQNLEPGTRARLQVPGFGSLEVSYCPRYRDKPWRAARGMPAPPAVMRISYEPTKRIQAETQQANLRAVRLSWTSRLSAPSAWNSMMYSDLHRTVIALKRARLPVPSEVDSIIALRASLPPPAARHSSIIAATSSQPSQL